MAKEVFKKIRVLEEGIEELRNLLQKDMAKKEVDKPDSGAMYALSSELDKLIIQYLRVKDKLEERGCGCEDEAFGASLQRDNQHDGRSEPGDAE